MIPESMDPNSPGDNCLCGVVAPEITPRLGKRMAYLLRYGALKEGLPVLPGGFVKLDDLLGADLMRWHHEEDVLHEIEVSKTVSGKQRFELRNQSGMSLVRATEGRRLEPPAKHVGSAVPRLLECCLEYVSKNIKKFDLEDFPDEFLLSRLFYRLKHEKRLTNANMSCVLGQAMECLNLNGLYITETTLKLITSRCKNLYSLELKSCGYVVTNKMVEMICKAELKGTLNTTISEDVIWESWLFIGQYGGSRPVPENLTHLKKLNFCDCGSLTDTVLGYPSKYGLKLQYLNINHVPNITMAGLKTFVTDNHYLTSLHVQGNKNIGHHEVEVLKSLSSAREPLEVFADCDKTCHQINTLNGRTMKCKGHTSP